MITKLENAIEVAFEAHRGQKDKAEAPYILHPLRVMNSVEHDEDLACIAVLHDVVEDTYVTLEDLERHGFNARVLAGVDAMTRRKGEKYDAYIERLCLSHDACVVKIHDIADNTKLRRLPPHEWKWFAGMQTRYLATEEKIAKALVGHLARVSREF